MYEALLACVPLFQDLSPRELTWISGVCREHEYATGEVLAHAGEGIAALFILVSGSVQVQQHQADGADHSMDQRGAGAVIGEMSLFETAPQHETIIALAPTVALVLPRWDFQAALRESPDIAIKLLAALSQRLR